MRPANDSLIPEQPVSGRKGKEGGGGRAGGARKDVHPR